MTSLMEQSVEIMNNKYDTCFDFIEIQKRRTNKSRYYNHYFTLYYDIPTVNILNVPIYITFVVNCRRN